MSCRCSCTGRDDELRLRDEQAFLDRQLAEAITLAEAGDWPGFESKWEAFMMALEQHLQYEETQIFPVFAQSGPLANHEVKELCAAHDEVRGEVKFLDRETQMPDLFIEQLRYLTEVLRRHKEHEERVLYPWLASLQSAAVAQGVKREDVCPSAKATDDLWWQNPMRHEQATPRPSR